MPDETFRWIVAGGVAIATLAICAMSVVMLVLFRAVLRLQTRVDHLADRAEPVIDSVRHLMVDSAPRIGDILISARQTAANACEISAVARDQAHRFAEVGRDITDRARAQAARVDAAVDDTVEQVHQFGQNVRAAVIKPVTEMSGVLAGIKAGVAAYAQGSRPSVARVTQDEEMFI